MIKRLLQIVCVIVFILATANITVPTKSVLMIIGAVIVFYATVTWKD